MKWNDLGNIELLVVDDDAFNRQLVVSLLGKIPSINFFQAEDGEEALNILNKRAIDMILLDLHMPKMDGYATLKAIKANPKYNFIPIAIITTDEQEMNKLYLLGADDFISKPFKLSELESRIYTHVEKRQYRQNYNTKKVEKKVIKKEQCATLNEIEKNQKEIFFNMTKLLNNDEYFKNIQVVATLVKALSKLIGYNKNRVDNIYYATIIKDIGRWSIKEKRPLTYQLSQKDKEIHHQYIIAGYQLLDNAVETEFIKIAKRIITQHQEHFDGSGFPKQQEGTQIHNIAYMVAMVETFHALLSQSTYLNQKIHSIEETYLIMKTQSGRRFHPQISKLFLEHFDYFIQLRERSLETLNKRSI